MDLAGAISFPLERSISSQSAQSLRSHRSASLRPGKTRKLIRQPSSSASSIIAPSDKSLTSFPSFSPEPFSDKNSDNGRARARYSRPGGVHGAENAPPSRDSSARPLNIVDTLTWRSSAREALFEDTPILQTVPGALHRSDDEHIERLITRHGAVALVRQIAGDLAQRDAQISIMRRRADERERALRRIIRDCGLSNLDLETRLRAVEAELKENSNSRANGGGLPDLMSDAMQDVMTENVYGERGAANLTIRASDMSLRSNFESGKGTASRGWRDLIWGGGTARRSGPNHSSESLQSTVIRPHGSSDRRTILSDDLFDPPSNFATNLQPPSTADAESVRSSSRGSSVHSANPKGATSLASLALRLVVGGAIANREGESRGRAASSSNGRPGSTRADSISSNRTSRSGRAVSVAAGPKALMAMNRPSPAVAAPNNSSKPQSQGKGKSMVGSPPKQAAPQQESYGPVEMDAILPPESQPPTLTQMFHNPANSDYLTDRFGFIYDQRRKKRQREAAQMAQHIRKGSRAEMLANIRTVIAPPSTGEDLPSPKWSVSSDQGRPESPSSLEERASSDEGKAKRWQDYLRIATVPTELLSHTPGSSALTEIGAGTGAGAGAGAGTSADRPKQRRPTESSIRPPTIVPPAITPPVITPTHTGSLPLTSNSAVMEIEVRQGLEQEFTGGTMLKEDAEPVKLLLKQLSEMHDSLQRDKTVHWNDFLRKVRAERRREGEAAIAAAAAAAEARYERPAVILPESRVVDGEMIGISDLGNKGKIGRAKWNEFKSLVLGGIPVAYRSKVWSECSGATALRIPGYYEDLVSQNGENDDPAVVGQIQMDIHRTLTDNIFFRHGPGVKKLTEVLVAYSRRNRDVGYCQGMNLITANLLLITPSAEDAFWILASIIENILPHGYYDDSLISSRADQQVLRQYVSTVLPKLSAHLDSLSVELEALTFQWFLSVFTDCLCAEALFRVWDVVLCTNDGSTFLFQVALALLKLNESNLLKCDSPAEVYTYINHHMTEHAISIDGLIQASEGLRRLVRREDVEQRRDKTVQAEKDSIAERSGKARKSNMETPAAAATITITTPTTSDSKSLDATKDQDGSEATLATESQSMDA